MNRPVRILVFGRSPVSGRAKTRLIPTLGPQGAADLYALLLEHALTTACAARVDGGVTLWLDAEPVTEEIELLADRYGIEVALQAPGDLGARMHGALLATLASGALPLLMGSDVPALTPLILEEAAALLGDGQEVVLAPALDGGYGLVGVTRPLPALFHDMPWSTASVLTETRRRCVRDGVRLAELDWVWDVDEASDLARLGEIADLADWRQHIKVNAAG